MCTLEHTVGTELLVYHQRYSRHLIPTQQCVLLSLQSSLRSEVTQHGTYQAKEASIVDQEGVVYSEHDGEQGSVEPQLLPAAQHQWSLNHELYTATCKSKDVDEPTYLDKPITNILYVTVVLIARQPSEKHRHMRFKLVELWGPCGHGIC